MPVEQPARRRFRKSPSHPKRLRVSRPTTRPELSRSRQVRRWTVRTSTTPVSLYLMNQEFPSAPTLDRVHRSGEQERQVSSFAASAKIACALRLMASRSRTIRKQTRDHRLDIHAISSTTIHSSESRLFAAPLPPSTAAMRLAALFLL